MEISELKHVIEAALLAAGRPISVDEFRKLLTSGKDEPPRQEIREAVQALQTDYAERGIELAEVASGFRIQVRPSMSPWLTKLWEIRPPRYSRALMETLAIIAYRQPVTRGDVEDVRGVGVSTGIIRTLLERGWVRVVGHRDVPGKPEMFGTTKEFLDYFGLKSLKNLPPLEDLKDLDALNVQLELPEGVSEGAAADEGSQAPSEDDETAAVAKPAQDSSSDTDGTAADIESFAALEDESFADGPELAAVASIDEARQGISEPQEAAGLAEFPDEEPRGAKILPLKSRQ